MESEEFQSLDGLWVWLHGPQVVYWGVGTALSKDRSNLMNFER